MYRKDGTIVTKEKKYLVHNKLLILALLFVITNGSYWRPDVRRNSKYQTLSSHGPRMVQS